MQICIFLTRSFKLAFWLNVLLFLIMVIILALNFAKIPKLTGQGPIIVFIIDFISNGLWLTATIFMISAYFKLSLLAANLHLITMVALWCLKLVELILTSILIRNLGDDNVLTLGDKNSTIIGLSIDISIIIPLIILGNYAKQYIFLKNNPQKNI